MRVFDRLDKRFIEESKTKQNLQHIDRRISIVPQSYYSVFVFLDFSRKDMPWNHRKTPVHPTTNFSLGAPTKD